MKGPGKITAVLLLALSGPAARAEERPLPKDLAPYFTPPAEFAGDPGDYHSPLLFADGRPVKEPADWQKRRQEILKTWHGFMGPWPEVIRRPRVEYRKKERREDFTQHTVRVEVAPGQMREGYLLVPDGKGPFPAVLVVFYDPETGAGLAEKPLLAFAHELTRRGFVTLSLGSPPESYYPSREDVQLQPLSFHAYVAANCYQALANLPEVDPGRVGVLGHSYGGKWAMFAAALYDKFACGAWSDPGIVFDERRPNVNYWERWYLGYEKGKSRKPGLPTAANPAHGAYVKLRAAGHDLHELHALVAPRPFLVSGGAEDPPARWKALNHTVAVNKLLGHTGRVGMTNRKGHTPTEESNAVLYRFIEHFLKGK